MECTPCPAGYECSIDKAMTFIDALAVVGIIAAIVAVLVIGFFAIVAVFDWMDR